MKIFFLTLGFLIYQCSLTSSSVITDNFPWIFSDCSSETEHMKQFRCMISKFQNPNWIEDSQDSMELRIEQKLYWHPIKRVRRECRAIPREEWVDLVNAINTLKNDKSLSPNVYDYFANLHRKEVVHNIHYGASFFGWHRFYILKFEELLRKINPNITLCFWDSRLDSVLPDPKDSIMFSEMFMGNMDGPVTKGPFAGWKTIEGIPLRRQVGGIPGYTLVQPEDIDMVLSKNHHFQIATPTADTGSNMEFIHNAVHGYIGGQMAQFPTSSQDPFFWIHHSFIDSVWEKFCAKLRRQGIDPQDDYVDINNEKHKPGKTMVHLPPLKNIDGYSEYFTKNILHYGEYAVCPDCLGSPFLTCDTKINKCRTITKYETPRFQNKPKRIDTNHLSKAKDDIAFLSGDENIDKWVFVPIKIVFRNGISKSISNINITGCEYINTGSDLCSKSVVIVQSNGITYHSNYRNYIINDVRIPQWAYSYVAVRNPTLGSSQSFVSITDKMGYPCAAYCYSEDDKNYTPCLGVISLTNDEPKMFSDTIDSARASDFHFEPLKADSPDPRIKLLFSCY